MNIYVCFCGYGDSDVGDVENLKLATRKLLDDVVDLGNIF